MRANRFFAASLTALTIVLGAALAAGKASAEAAGEWPTKVDAVYTLHFSGLGELGKFRYQSQIQGAEYTINGSAEIKIPLVYHWSAKVAGHGRLHGDDINPAGYTFTSESKPIVGGKKHLAIRLGLTDRAVTQVNIVPPHNPGGAHYVPVKPEHLKSVTDPLTAVMMMTRVRSGAPCGQRFSLFDGKQRFDLATSAAGQQAVHETRPSGQPAVGYLCKVRYTPVAGFKDTEDFRNNINSSNVEVALRPVPSANLLVPYKVTVATKWGTATMQLHRMDIVAPGQRQIALVH